MLSLEVRKKTGEAEVRRVTGPLVTIGASSGNQVVVRARGVSGRHARIVEKDGGYFLDVFRGVEPVFVNGKETLGGPLGIGDRITIGEASITLLNGRPAGRITPVGDAETAAAPEEFPAVGRQTAAVPVAAPAGFSETEYRGLRLDVFRRLKREPTAESAAREVARFLSDELGPEEWAVGTLEPDGTFRRLASTFHDDFEFPARLAEDLRRAMGPVRVDEERGPLALFASPGKSAERKVVFAARETLRLPPRAAAFVEEVAQLADLAWSSVNAPAAEPAPASAAGSVEVPREVEIVAASDVMRRLMLDLPRIARSNAPVLVSGEVGAGKDLIAAAIHRHSDAAAGPYVVVDCSSMNRLEEEIFGRPAGSRGDRRHGGRLDDAHGGTLVLNEVGYLPPAAQSRLLDTIAAVAGDEGPRGRIRWVATTSSNLLPAVESGGFRRDLYFRLAVLTVRLPSLAERREDIPALFEHFARRHAVTGLGLIEPDALNALLTYRYPGNARELENEVVRLAAVCGPEDPIGLERLDPKFREAEAGLVLHEVDDLKKIVESVERQVIDRVMRKVEGNQSRGAELLNISRGSLIAKMAEFGIRDYRYLRRERKRGTGA
jgi:DNA-binding NtrC family response regulator